MKQNNNKYIKYLLNIPKSKHSLINELAAKYENNYNKSHNCTTCANCCKKLGPRITNTDINKAAKYLNIKSNEFISKFLIIDEDNDYIFNSLPCPFLKNNLCEIYEFRPKACREYPHISQQVFMKKINIMSKNIDTCPTVYYVIKSICENENRS